MNALRSQFCQQRLRFRFQAAATAGVYVSLGSVNKETCKNHMKEYIVKYPWGVAHVLRVYIYIYTHHDIPNFQTIPHCFFSAVHGM